MAIPTTFTNLVPNPLPVANGLGTEIRRNLIPNPLMAPTTATTQIRVNDHGNPSFEAPLVGTGGWWDNAANCTPDLVYGTGVVNGSKAVKLTPNGATSDTYLGYGNIGSRAFPLIANGKTIEVSGTITIPTAQTGTLNARARTLMVFTKNSSQGGYTSSMSPAAPNSPGTYRLKATITIETGSGVELFMRLHNGSQNTPVYWDSIMVQDASTIANAGSEYFDGSMSTVDTQDGRLVRGWLGTANNARSNESVYGINGVTATAGAFSRWTGLRSYAGDGCMSLGWNATSATMVAGAEETVTLPAATQHTFSAYVWVPTGSPTVKLRAAGPGMTSVDSAASSTNNAWQRLSVTFTTVTAGTYTLSLRNFAAVTAASTSVNSDAWQLETGATATSFFSGVSSAPNLSYQWTGAANLSASTETGLAMPLYTGVNASVVASSSLGIIRVGVIPSSASTDSKAYIGDGGPGALRLGLQPGKTYRVSASLTLTAALTGTASTTNARNITFYAKVGAGAVTEQRTASSANVAGSYYHSMLFTVPVGATEAYISLNNGHPTGGGTANWNTVMVTEAEFVRVLDWMGDIPDLPQLAPNAAATVASVTVSNVSKASVVPAAAGNDSYARWLGTDTTKPLPLGIKPGNSYTLEYEIQVPVIQTGTLNTNARRAVIIMTTPGGSTTTLATQHPNTATTATRTVNFTTPADLTGIEIRLYNGAATGGGAVYYNRVKLTNTSLTDYAGVYFDGDSGTAYNNRMTRWLGTPQASASQHYYRGLWVEGNSTVSPPRVTLTAAGLGLNKLSQVTILRLAGTDSHPVPGWINKNVLDIGVAIDWLVPLNTNVTYQLIVDGAQIDSSTISFTSPAAWVADPLIPADALPVYVVPTGDSLQLAKAAMASKTHSVENDTVQVMGAKYPISRSTNRQMLQSINLTMNAPSNATSDAFHKMIEGTPILAIRTHPSWGNMPPLIYVSCQVTEAPLNRQVGGQFTVWEITGDVVAPVTRGPLVTTVTHAEVQAILNGRTHMAVRDINSAKRWADILADPITLGG